MDIERIKNILYKEGYRWTTPRMECLRVLAESNTPLTAEQIHNRLSHTNIDLVSIYRNLQMFSSMKIICKVDLTSQGQRYQMGDLDHDSHHHHHLLCQNCGRSEAFEECIIEKLTKTIFKDKGFQVLDHQLTFTGTCKTCSV